MLPFTDEGQESQPFLILEPTLIAASPSASPKPNSPVSFSSLGYRPACFTSQQSYSFAPPSSVLGGAKWCLERTHGCLQLLDLHFQH